MVKLCDAICLCEVRDSTCAKTLSNSRISTAGICVPDDADNVALPADQVVEGAVGSAGVAGGDGSSAVHSRHQLSLVWAGVFPRHQRCISAAL